jgi:ABC-type multidrug transport system fused ATPase/permease subunit
VTCLSNKGSCPLWGETFARARQGEVRRFLRGRAKGGRVVGQGTAACAPSVRAQQRTHGMGATATCAQVTVIAGYTIAFVYSWQMALVVTAAVPFIAVAGYFQGKFMVGFSSKARGGWRAPLGLDRQT